MFDMRITERVHQMLAPYIHEGDLVIDGTSGNGNDTLFLANQVGDRGTVLSFDLQKEALQSTYSRLQHEMAQANTVLMDASSLTRMSSLHPGVYLMHLSHEYIDLPQVPWFAKEAKIACIMFNFGYLPGGDKHVTTQKKSSLCALEKSLALIKPKGVISLVTYPGHQEGYDEDYAIEKLLSKLPGKQYEVLRMTYVNRSQKAPKQYLIYKRCCQTTDNGL